MFFFFFVVKRIELNQFGEDIELSHPDPISEYIYGV